MSFRELAEAAGVSTATLRHYFGDRDGVLEAALEFMHRQGLEHLTRAATLPMGPVRESLAWLLEQLVLGWRFGVGPMHALGIRAGLRHESLGPAYVNLLLEPTLQATEARLARHVADGELERCDVRHAALELISPLLLGLLHQDSLFGAKCRPLDLDTFLEEHLERFLRAYGAKPAAKKASGR